MTRRAACLAAAVALAALWCSGPTLAGTSPELEEQGIASKGILAAAKAEAKKAGSQALDGKQVETQQDPAAPGMVARRIVSFKPGVSPQRRTQVVQAAGGVVLKDLRIINAVAVLMPNTRVQSFEASLAAQSEVRRIEEDFYQNWLVGAPAVLPVPARPPVQAAEEPPKPQGQQVPWGIDTVKAKDAWSVTRGAGVKVAVVDTGVDLTHPDLKVAGGFNTIDNAASANDDNGHGSHVAGTIAGVDNEQGVVGVAPEVALYAVKVLNSWGSGTFADVIEGIQWTAENKMDVANFSLGASKGTPALEEAVKAAAAAGVAIIAAAGNSGGAVGFPGAYDSVMAVAASDKDGKVADFSSRGPEVDIIAPGVDVYSTYMGGKYDTLSGTSMATPHMTGLAALAIASRGVHGIQAVMKALQGAATPLPGAPPEQQGSGLVDAGRLVRGG